MAQETQSPVTVTPKSTVEQVPIFDPNATVAPTPPKPRRRKRSTNTDSIRLIAQRDSIQKAAIATAANPNSAFNIGSQQPNQTTNAAAPIVTPAPSPEVPILQKSDNPFEILRGTSANPVDNSVANAPNSSSPSLLNKGVYTKNFMFWVFLVALILMAFVVANARSAINNAYTAIVSDNALRQIYKEPMGWGSFVYLALYGVFWLNAGIFVYLLQAHWGTKMPFGQYGTFFACVAGVGIVFVIKHAILYLIALVFPIEKPIRTYNFIILTSGILLGLVLMPINIFIAYVPADMRDFFIYLGLFVVGSVYLVRSLRSFAVALPLMIDDRFHFLLYLCAVEIAPLMILIKFITLQS